jgi:Ca2+-binding RTX toxin-like protein
MFHTAGLPARAAVVTAALMVASFGYVGPAAAASDDCFGQTPTVVGTAGDDVIEATSGVDVIAALGGNDTIKAFSGNAVDAGGDVICGGDGKDVIDGSAGPDSISGGDGDDVIRGWGGHDRIISGDGNDVCVAGVATTTSTPARATT